MITMACPYQHYLSAIGDDFIRSGLRGEEGSVAFLDKYCMQGLLCLNVRFAWRG